MVCSWSIWDAMKHDVIPEANQHRCNLGQHIVVEKRLGIGAGKTINLLVHVASNPASGGADRIIQIKLMKKNPWRGEKEEEARVSIVTSAAAAAAGLGRGPRKRVREFLSDDAAGSPPDSSAQICHHQLFSVSLLCAGRPAVGVVWFLRWGELGLALRGGWTWSL